MILGLASLALAHVPELYIVSPDEDWCRTIDNAQTGDILMLQPGDYLGPCTIEGNPPDYPGEVLTVQAFDLYNPPVLRYGGGEHVLELTGQRVILSALVIDAVPDGVAGVAVEAEDSTVRFCTFTNTEGAGVVAGKGASRLFVDDNTFFLGGGTAVALGCDDGGCAVGDFEVADNLLIGIGAGVIVHPGSAGAVRDNTFDDVGLGVRVAGEGDAASRVEANLIRGTTGLEIVGGPVLVRNNIVLADRALTASLTGPSGIRVLGNTLVGRVAATTDGWSAEDELTSNALQGDVALAAGGLVAGNVTCDAGTSACWLDPSGLDYFPAPSSPLRGAGVTPPDAVLLGDWCGRVRADPPTAGAIEAVGDVGFGPLVFDFKKRFDCALDELTTPTGTGSTDTGGAASGTGGSGGTTPGTSTTDPVGGQPDSGDAPKATPQGSGCGCAAGGGAAPWWRGLGRRRRASLPDAIPAF